MPRNAEQAVLAVPGMLDLLGSRRVHFLLTALLRIAASASPLSGKQLADMLHCPRRYLEPDLQALVSAGILESRRGAGGGYLIAISPHRISLLDILQCIAPETTCSPDNDSCRLQQEVVQPLILQMRKNCLQNLATLTLASCLENARKADILNQPASAPNFSI